MTEQPEHADNDESAAGLDGFTSEAASEVQDAVGSYFEALVALSLRLRHHRRTDVVSAVDVRRAAAALGESAPTGRHRIARSVGGVVAGAGVGALVPLAMAGDPVPVTGVILLTILIAGGALAIFFGERS